MEAREGDAILLLRAALQMTQPCRTRRSCCPSKWAAQAAQKPLALAAVLEHELPVRHLGRERALPEMVSRAGTRHRMQGACGSWRCRPAVWWEQRMQVVEVGLGHAPTTPCLTGLQPQPATGCDGGKGKTANTELRHDGGRERERVDAERSEDDAEEERGECTGDVSSDGKRKGRMGVSREGRIELQTTAVNLAHSSVLAPIHTSRNVLCRALFRLSQKLRGFISRTLSHVLRTVSEMTTKCSKRADRKIEQACAKRAKHRTSKTLTAGPTQNGREQ